VGREVKVWRLDGLRKGVEPVPAATLEHKQEVWVIACSPDGKTLAAGTGTWAGGQLKLWDTTNWKERAALADEGGVLSLAFSRDSKILASAGTSLQIRLWDVATARPRSTLWARKGDARERVHQAAIRGLAFSPDGRHLVSAGEDLMVKLWHVSRGYWLRYDVYHTAEVRGLVFAPDGKSFVSVGGDGQLIRWLLRQGKDDLDVSVEAGNLLRSGSRGIRAQALSPNGTLIATGDQDRQVILWDARTGRHVGTLFGHRGPLSALVFSPDGRWLASANSPLTQLTKRGGNGFNSTPLQAAAPWELKVWEVATGEEVQRLDWSADRRRPFAAAAFSPDGRRLAVARGHRVTVFDVEARKEEADIDGGPGPLTALLFSPNGKFLATGSSDGRVRLLSTATWKEEAVLRGHEGAVYSLSFTANGRTLASGSGDRSVRLWNRATGRGLLTLAGQPGAVTQLLFAADGSRLVGLVAGQTQLWEAASPAEVAERAQPASWQVTPFGD
jgi:WD40 repeat protein